MADDLPDFLPGLLRIAAQGRSLGIHLVLATQRPAGAVSADMRANLALRIALRLVDPADSQDVIEAPHAARIPSTVPGRAVVRRGSAAPVALQCAHAGSLPASTAADVRRAPSWGSWRGSWGGPTLEPPTTSTDPSGSPARTLSLSSSRPPAPLRARRDSNPHPRHGCRGCLGRPSAKAFAPTRRSSIRAGRPISGGPTDPTSRTSPTGLTFALADIPEAQRRAAVTWAPASGALAVMGRARSGRSTTL